MKFPSIIRTPKHNRFSFEPRYYDPIKEEIEEKLKQARQEKHGGENNSSHASHISAAFGKRQQKRNQTSAIQMIIAIVLIVTFTAWLFYGNEVFYVYLMLSPAYFYWRFKSRGGKR